MKKVYIALADGFEEVEALTVVDLLRRAGVDVKMVSVTANKEVQGAHQIVVLCDLLIESIKDKADMLVLPGGAAGTHALMEHKGLAALIKEYNAEGRYLAAICAAPSVYGKLGLLKGYRATCYPGWEGNLLGAITTDEHVVCDHNFITSKGPGTSMEFALYLVTVLCGESKAKELKEDLLYVN